jgi:hypothetical protein
MEERNAEKGLLQEMLEVHLFELKVLKARDLRESTEIIEMILSHLFFFFFCRKPGAENHGRVLEEKIK